MADQDWKAALLSKLSELFHIVLALVGVVIVILAAAKGLKYKDASLNIVDPISRIALALFGLLVMALGIYLRKTGASEDAGLPKAKDHDIKISYPKPGAKIAKADVRGTIKKALPDSFSLWVFRVYDDGRFYPLRECVIYESEASWEAPNCDVGGKSGEYRSFSVNIVGPDGFALITYVHEAGQRFRPIRDELVAKSGNQDVPYLPSVLKRTRDIVYCDSVKVEKL